MKTHPDYSIETLAVISEDEMIPLCAKYGVHWVKYENFPVGRKKNFGLKKAKEFDFDFLMEIGSDDLVTNDLLTQYLDYVDKWKFFGVRDAAYIDSSSGACRRLISNSTYGAGRMIHKSILELSGYSLWKDNISQAMDNNSVFSLMRKGIFYKQVPPMDVPGVIDIKSNVNIWPFNHFLGKEYDIKNIYEKLSPKEIELIECEVAESILETSTEE